jgi:hypothetical protein
MSPIADASSHFKARIAGVFYLVTFIGGMFALVLGRRVGVYFYAANAIASAAYVVVTLLFYDLFKPVNKGVSLLAAVISLAGCVTGTLSLFHLASIPINNLVFFGFYCLLIGYLIFRSTFLPRALGVLMALGGLGWLTFLSPTLAKSLSPYNLFPGILGEGVLTMWLLLFGLNVQRWNEQARAAKPVLI